MERDSVFVSPGERVELLVRGGAAGSYALKALPYDHDFDAVSPETVIATVASRPALPSWPVSAAPLLRRRPWVRNEGGYDPLCEIA